MFNFVSDALGGGIEAVTGANALLDGPTQYFLSMIGAQMFTRPLNFPMRLAGERHTADFYVSDRRYHLSVTIADGRGSRTRHMGPNDPGPWRGGWRNACKQACGARSGLTRAPQG